MLFIKKQRPRRSILPISNWSDLRIGQEQHAFVAGMTGCGKSSLCEFLVNDPDKENSVVYDPKHSRTLGEWRNQTFVYSEQDDPRHPDWGLPHHLVMCEDRRITYRPSLEEAESAQDQLNFFRWIYWRETTRIYVDECSALLGDSYGNKYFKGCLTRGREKGISVLATTQRPVSIPLQAISESSIVFLFALNMPEDRARMTKITGVTEEEQLSLRKFEFFVYDVERRQASDKITLALPA